MNIGFGDKISHLLAYTFFGILIARALYFQNRFPFFSQNYLWLTIFIGILYGISDEFHQSFVPGRTVEFADALADSIGIILGVNIFSYRERLIILWKKLFTKQLKT